MGFCAKGLKNDFETAVVNEASVFEPLKFYCMYTMFEDSSLYSLWENCDSNLALKYRKRINKEKNKSNEFDSQSNNSLSICIHSFKNLA